MKTVTAKEMAELDRHAIVDLGIPSLTLMGNAGKVLGAAIKATKTITFAAAKTGFYKEEGTAHTGDVVVVDIGIPVV